LTQARNKSADPDTNAAAPAEPAFETSLADLERIVRQLEEGRLGLSDSLAHYEQGVRRLRECYELLERAERRIELLERVEAGGQAVTRPFDDAATTERHVLTGEAPAEAPAPRAQHRPAANQRPTRPAKGADLASGSEDASPTTDSQASTHSPSHRELQSGVMRPSSGPPPSDPQATTPEPPVESVKSHSRRGAKPRANDLDARELF
jgi:exodeoxyribonuclease VII small subunit